MSENINIGDVISKIREQVALSSAENSQAYIPDIMEFCYSKKYLNMKAIGKAGTKPITLFKSQEIILKCFYRGQTGNEHIVLTPEEIEFLYNNKMQMVLDKYHSEAIFRELVLVLGRRCVSEDTLLTLDNGEQQSIGKLWDQKETNVKVISLDERDYKLKHAHGEIIYNGEQDVYRVVLSDGRSVDATDNHPFLTMSGWKQVSDLVLSDYVAAPAPNHSKSSTMTRDQALKINSELTDEHLEKITSPDILWIQIKSIEFAGRKRTFDVSVSENHMHNFVANDIILHNSGKDFMVSIIALYECMKLLESAGGSPFGYYGIAPGNPIYIITVATSADQARILYYEIKQRMQSSEYFKNKLGKVEADRLWFLTPEDKKNNSEASKSGMFSAQTSGSVCIMSGHSNSEGLLGKRIYSLLLDEVASFKNTGGATSGDRIYSALAPSTADFKHPYRKYKDVNGEEIPLLDSKIISISSPRGEEGMLFHLYNTAQDNPNRIAFRMPTWKVNEMITEASLRSEFKFMNPSEFMMEFGAEFSGTSGEKFIPDAFVDKAIDIGRNMNLSQRITGSPGIVYYAHLDPAATSHNYALVVVHVEERIRIKDNESGVPKKEKFKMFVVDHIKIWHPKPNSPVSVHEVDEYIINLARLFRFGIVTYDAWNSLASIQKLRAKGIPTRMTPFRKQYKMQIYDHIEHLLVNNHLALPYKGVDAELLSMELKCLKRIYGPTGFSIKPDHEAAVNSDDACDALAGACGTAMEQFYNGYAKGGVVHMPQSRSMPMEQGWNIGRGQYAPQQWQFMNKKFGKF